VSAAIVLAGAVGGAYVLWPKSPPPQGACAPVTLSAAAKRKLALDARRIELTVDHSSDGSRDREWRDPVTRRSRQVSYGADGRTTNVHGNVERGRVDISTWVDYEHHMAILDRTTLARALPGNDAIIESQLYRRQLQIGTARVVGTETIAGQRLVHVRSVQHIPPRAFAAHTLRVDTWLDPSTYVPALMRTDDDGNWATDRFAWLPRTPANVAKTIVRIPRGFTVVHPGHGSSHSFQVILSRTPAPRCRQS